MANNTDLLSQVKNQYVQELAHPKDIPCVNWNEFMDFNDDNSVSWFDRHYNEVIRRYAKAVSEQALRNAAENATIETYYYGQVDGTRRFVQELGKEVSQDDINYYSVNKESIINPKNIPEL